MMSRNLYTVLTAREADGRWLGKRGRLLVDIKKTHSVRDARSAFLELAYRLQDEPASARAVCVFVDSRLSAGRLQEELERFRALVHPAIAERIHFLIEADPGRDGGRQVIAAAHRPAFSGSMQDAPADFFQWLEALVAGNRADRPQAPLAPRHAVLTALARLRLANQPPVTVKHLKALCGVSYPTAAAVLKPLGDKGWLEEPGARGVRLRHLTGAEWLELARDHAKARTACFFTDPTAHVSPGQMVQRLGGLQAAGKLPAGIRVGGVIGALQHFPGLDITAPPRLDLSVDAADPTQVAALLDAGLQPKSRPEQRIDMAVHLTSHAAHGGGLVFEAKAPWADQLECLADLIEMGYVREASEMAEHTAQANAGGFAA